MDAERDQERAQRGDGDSRRHLSPAVLRGDVQGHEDGHRPWCGDGLDRLKPRRILLPRRADELSVAREPPVHKL